MEERTFLRELPSIDSLLREEAVQQALLVLPRRLVLQAAQETVASYRSRFSQATDETQRPAVTELSPARLAPEIVERARQLAAPNFKAVLNATGIIIHTNLGRAPFAGTAVEAVQVAAEGYSNLELSLADGRRGSRQDHMEALLCRLSGAEAAVVVNNNAAAVYLVLHTFAAGHEVVVSRGQLVEIGGSFRIPEIMAASGARLIEVGTTNKTYLRDYEAAVTVDSAAFLKVHTSNYHMVGFTAAVEASELATLAHSYGLMMIEDLGSGVFLDTTKYGLSPEPRVQDSIAAGADLVTFSGDKLLGGPQSGIILGRKDLIERLRANQLARILRIDKLSVASLEATLRLYSDEAYAVSKIPVWRMLSVSPQELRQRAEALAARFSEAGEAVEVAVLPGFSKIGGGALPASELPTYLVTVKSAAGSRQIKELTERLREGDPPVVARLQQDRLFFDPRTIFAEQDHLLVEAFLKACGHLQAKEPPPWNS